MIRKFYTGIAGLALLLLAGCQKYASWQPIAGDTYIRIFNDITNYDLRAQPTGAAPDIVNKRVLCILIDPQQDATGRFSGAAIVGDYLQGRSFYAGAYETHPNDDVSVYNNLDYPGAYRVQTGGIINGLDLSRWERIAPGKHRLVILRRTSYGRYFTEYTPQGRDTVFKTAIDTTLDLSQSTIYTMEVFSKQTNDALPLKLTVRKETLDKEDFSDTAAMYVNFFNYLEMPGSPAALDVYYQTEYVVNTTNSSPIMYGPTPKSYATTPPGASPGDYFKITTPEQRLTTLTGSFGSMTAYMKIPMPPVDSFYYTEGPALKQYRLPFDRPHTLFNFYLPGQSAATGASPFYQLLGNEFTGQTLLNVAPENGFSYGGTGAPILSTTYQTITINGINRSYPLVTSFALMNVYPALNQLSTAIQGYQTSTQRSLPAGLLP